MKRILLLPTAVLMIILAAIPALKAQERTVSLADETLTYDVIYKWGFINKVAGYATMSLRNDGPYYRASVIAENAPWANSIYMLRDTLYSTMTRDHFYPVSYTFIAHENGKYKKDVLSFSHTGDTFSAKAVRYKKPKNGGPMTHSTIELEAKGMTVDMLSSFFYLRSLDFDAMAGGTGKTVNIFSGSKKEKLKITYLGRQKVTVNGREFDTYYINFTFTRNGVESSAPIKGWITTDQRRIPLKVEGKLPVGKVRALYTGPNP
ncbi:MAG: DUF3108 domain-containing protein [Duncaniella sp.]|nr:DUF3108 domain-containing protein [Duncaniella sp.]